MCMYMDMDMDMDMDMVVHDMYVHVHVHVHVVERASSSAMVARSARVLARAVRAAHGALGVSVGVARASPGWCNDAQRLDNTVCNQDITLTVYASLLSLLR